MHSLIFPIHYLCHSLGVDATSITWFWLCISLAHIRTLENTQTQFTILLCFQSLTLDDVGKRIIFIIFRQGVNGEEGAKSVAVKSENGEVKR